VKDHELQFVKRTLTQALQLPGAVASQALVPAQDRAVRQRAAAVSVPPLDDDVLLDKIFDFVGSGDYFYVAGVCRRWRGRYITLCYKAAANEVEEEAAEVEEAEVEEAELEEAGLEEAEAEEQAEREEYRSLIRGKLRTSLASAVITADRQQMALDDRFRFAQLYPGQFGDTVAHSSLEPVAVFALAKQYDLRWDGEHCLWAAIANRLDLLQWLHSRGCPWNIDTILVNISLRSLNLAVLKWLRSKTGPWARVHRASLLQAAVRTENYPAAEWLREQGAAWPKNFHSRIDSGWIDWTQPMVKYALDHGAAWGEWDCQKLLPEEVEQHIFPADQQVAKELLDWAHANGCPCTCGQARA
jgi:hypothetical protein